MPFARAVEANGWLYVSGQVAMEKGEIVGGGVVAESRKAIENMIAILHEAGYGVEDVVRVGVWLDDPRDFWTFNGIYAEYFGAEPAGPRLRPVADDGRLQSGNRLHRLQVEMTEKDQVVGCTHGAPWEAANG